MIEEIQDTSLLPSTSGSYKYNGSYEYEWGSGVSNGKIVTTGNSDNFLIPINNTSSEWSISDVLTITKSNIGTIGGESIDMTFSIDKVTVGPRKSGSKSAGDYMSMGWANANGSTIFDFGIHGDSTDYSYGAKQQYDYTITFTYSKSGKVVNLPFTQIVSDLDGPDDSTAYQYWQETFAPFDDYYNTYYVYEGTGILNTAYANADHADGVSDDAEINLVQPELAIVKDVRHDTLNSGDTAVYTIYVSQVVEDGIAHNVVVTDELPEGLELKSVECTDIDGKIEINGNTFTVSYDSLTDNEEAVIQVKAKVLTDAIGKDVINSATASASNAESVSDDATFKVLQPVLNITKDVDGSSFAVGESVVYTIKVTQTEEDAIAYNVEVTDELPEGLKLESVALKEPDGEASQDGNTAKATIKRLAYGDTAVITVQARTEESLKGKNADNIAMAVADGVDEVSDNAVIKVTEETVNSSKGDSVKTGEMIAGIIIAVVVIAAAVIVIIRLRKKKQ